MYETPEGGCFFEVWTESTIFTVRRLFGGGGCYFCTLNGKEHFTLYETPEGNVIFELWAEIIPFPLLDTPRTDSGGGCYFCTLNANAQFPLYETPEGGCHFRSLG